MKLSSTVLLALTTVTLAAPAFAQDTSAVRGKEVFDLWCYSCHKRLNPGDMPVAGTSSLQRNYNGSKPAALEDRTDLTPAYIKAMVRHGYKSMPPSRKTEISDADLDALTHYLVKQ
jgi:cytochrome c5